MDKQEKIVWTIGHSTRSLDEIVNILTSFQIEIVIDIRAYPGSKRYPHFNKESLITSLKDQKIEYVHLPGLGGRRKPLPNSTNSAWRNEAFRGYADHMESKEFRDSIQRMEEIANEKRVVYMCSESVWWRCHRALVSDYLKARGWKVMHIMNESKSSEHPYTKPAQEVQGKLFY